MSDEERVAPRGAVFLSYASQDAEAVRGIAEALRAAGVEVWFDQNELVGGDAWDGKIRKQISECALFVPVISANTQARREGYFRLEWRLAAQRTHMMSETVAFLLPIVIDGTRDAEADVPTEFKAVQWTRLGAAGSDEAALHGPALAAFGARVGRLLNGSAGAVERKRPAEPRAIAPSRGTVRPAWWRWAVPLVGVALGCALWLLASRWGQEDVRRPGTVGAAQDSSLMQVWDLLNRPEMARAELEAAELLCRKAIEADPSNADIWAAWSSVNTWFVFHGLDRSPARVEAAREYAAKALRLAAGSFEARLAQALFWVRADLPFPRIKEAQALLRELLRERPEEPRAMFVLGFSLADRDEGFALLERVARDPRFAAAALNDVGWIHFFGGRFDRAQDAADRSLAARPYWNNLGLQITLALYVQGDTARARRFLDQMPASALQEDWGVGFAWKVALWSREPLRALAAVESVQREWIRYFFGDSPRAFLQAVARQAAGQQLAARRDYQRALEQLNKALGDNPNNGACLVLKAVTLRELGDEAAAQEVYRLVLELGDSLPANYRGLLKLQFEPTAEGIALVRSMTESPYTLSMMNTFRVEFAAGALRLNPWFDRLRGEAGFDELVRAVSQREAGANGDSPKRAGVAAAPPSEKSVAVLAFENRSDDRANEYFSDGISEELLTVLQKIPGLKVAARTSAFSFKGRNATVREVGEKLGMAHVVEGSVQKVGNRVKISARLSRAASNEELWSKSFGPLELTDVFAIQSEIAQAIVGELRGRLTGEAPGTVAAEIAAQVRAAEGGGTRHVEAHQAYLEGVFWVRQYSVPAAIRGAERLRRAVALDDGFALAWAELSRAGWIRGGFGETQEDFEAGFRLAREAADRALALAPNLAAAHLAKADVHGSFDLDWQAAGAALARARSLEPENPTVLSSAARLASALGRIEEGLAFSERAIALDPLNSERRRQRAYALLCAGRLAEAKTEFMRMIELSPKAPWGHAGVSLVLTLEGRFAEARREAEKEDTAWTRLFARAIAEFGAGTPAADATLAEFKREYANGAAAQIAWVHAFRKEPDEAFRWLDRAVRQRDGGLNWTKSNPVMQALHSDGRWTEFLQRIGLDDGGNNALFLRHETQKPARP